MSAAWLPRRLRFELMYFPRPDGGLDLLDLIFERVVSLSAAEARALEAGDPALLERLDTEYHLCEGQVATAMRWQAWLSRSRGRPVEDQAERLARFEWEQARELPELVASEWRSPERMRRLAEERLAGRRYLPLPGFLGEEAAARLATQAEALAYARMDTEVVHADRHLLGADELDEWRALMGSLVLRRIFGAVLGVELPERLLINAWRLGRGDAMHVHPDGRLYRGTLSVGLCAGWTAADGGAIAFGEPTESGFLVRERWLPHAGDALLFAPAHDSWHAVEPVRTDRVRHSLTGWWTAPDGHQHPHPHA